MGQYFDYFPTVAYDIAKSNYTNYQNVTDIFFRVAMIKETMDNIFAYYIYDIVDGDKPEVLAEKIYGSPETHWIILMANDRLDGSYDWPLNYNDFNNYLANKYRATAGGSSLSDSQVIEWSQGKAVGSNSVHHYEKVVERTDMVNRTTTTFRYVVDYAPSSVSFPEDMRPYDYYTSLPVTGDYENYNIQNRTVREKIYRNVVTIFDYELQQNEDKRQIKVIKPEYALQIINELKNLTKVGKQRLRALV